MTQLERVLSDSMGSAACMVLLVANVTLDKLGIFRTDSAELLTKLLAASNSREHGHLESIQVVPFASITVGG
jgi:hypothetical protein